MHKDYSLQFHKQKCLPEHLLTTSHIQALCFAYSMSFHPYSHHVQCALANSPWEKLEFHKELVQGHTLLRDRSSLQSNPKFKEQKPQCCRMVKPGHPLHTAPPADMQRRGTCAAAPAHMYFQEVWLGQPQGEPS